MRKHRKFVANIKKAISAYHACDAAAKVKAKKTLIKEFKAALYGLEHVKNSEHQDEIDTLKQQLRLRIELPDETFDAQLATLDGYLIEDEPVAIDAPMVMPATPAPAQPETVSAEVVEELLEVFIEEAVDLLVVIKDNFDKTDKAHPGEERVIDMKRDLHTLKGGARMINLTEISFIAHQLEQMLETILVGKLHNLAEMFDGVACLLNNLNHAVQFQKSKQPLPDMQAWLALVEQSANSHFETGIADIIEQAPNLMEAVTVSRTRDFDAKVSNETIRLPFSILMNIGNYCDEMSVAQVGITRKINDVNGFMDESMQASQKLMRYINQLLEYAALRQTNSNKADATAVVDETGIATVNDANKLNTIAFGMSEGVHDLMDITDTIINTQGQLNEMLMLQSRILTSVQSVVLKSSMISFSEITPRIQLLANQLAKDVNKAFDVHIQHTAGEVDRVMVGKIVPIIEHILRNAIDHGIEAPDARLAVSKPERGQIAIEFSRSGNDVIIVVRDDGRGIDVEVVKQTAISRGFIKQDDPMSPEQVLQLILLPRFSTRKEVSEISGRGIGMDVVHNEIQKLSGQLKIKSTQGVGTAFQIRLPCSLSFSFGLVFKVLGKTYTLPTSNIIGVTRLETHLTKIYLNGMVNLLFQDKFFKVKAMSQILKSTTLIDLDLKVISQPLLIINAGGIDCALLVDEVIGNQEMIMQSPNSPFAQAPLYLGVSFADDGEVILVLNAVEIGLKYKKLCTQRNVPEVLFEKEKLNIKNKILVVDDSFTVRKYTANILERYHYQVTTARDGVEALELLNQFNPDLIITDLEMPRMTGIELAQSVRIQYSSSVMPIIMITSRTNQSHQDLATEAGVDHFLGKPFQSDVLLALIGHLLTQLESDNG